jgi:hypothetical protein
MTLREFNNPMNSLKSACSFAKSTPMTFDQFQQEVEPFRGGQLRVKLVVGSIGILKAEKDLSDSFHESILHPGTTHPHARFPAALR